MGHSRFEIPLEVIRSKFEVENMEGPIHKPYTYVKCHLLFGDHKIQ
jgi:hypothetical protein